MKIIPRPFHGILDYVVGAGLIAAPWLFGFADRTSAMYVPIVLGFGALIYSLLTNYELGVVRLIPFSVHLGLDVASGLLLVVSPWLFHFQERVYLPHLLIGVFEVLAGFMTRNPVSTTTPIHHTPGQSRTIP